MPLVLAQNEVTESGHDYADVFGVVYEYPTRYRTLVVPGTPFVYYHGGRRPGGRRVAAEYIGQGVIGEIRPSPRAGHLICTIHGFLPFPEPVSLKVGEIYREPGANGRPSREVGVHFRQGVRVLDDLSFSAILRDAQGALGRAGAQIEDPAEPDRAPLMEIALELAVAEARRRWPEEAIEPSRIWTPASGIRVGRGSDALAWIGVKGTAARAARFSVSEGERAFANAHADRYRLWVWTGINTERRRGELVEHRGALSEPATALTPTRWTGILTSR